MTGSLQEQPPHETVAKILLAPGLVLAPGHLDRTAQEALAAAIEGIVAAAPWFTPRMPRSGRPFSVRMTNCGALGWVSDRDGGYRYQATHPETGEPWPPIPPLLIELWREFANYPHPPEACLVNFYDAGARMGLHQDRDEADLGAAVVSISLGDSCVFRFGGLKRSDPSRRIELHSGDVLAFGGPSRLRFHGVDKILGGSSRLLKEGGRINLTLRRVAPPDEV